MSSSHADNQTRSGNNPVVGAEDPGAQPANAITAVTFSRFYFFHFVLLLQVRHNANPKLSE